MKILQSRTRKNKATTNDLNKIILYLSKNNYFHHQQGCISTNLGTWGWIYAIYLCWRRKLLPIQWSFKTVQYDHLNHWLLLCCCLLQELLWNA